MSARDIDYPKLNRFVLLLFFGYVSSFFLQIGSRIEIFGTIRLEMLLAAALLVVSIVYRPGIMYRPTGLLPWVLMLLVFVAIQVPFSVDYPVSVSVFIDRFLKFSVMGIFISVFAASPAGLKIFLAAFLLSCFKMGQEGMIGNLTGAMVWENQGVMRLHGSTRMYGHPNSFSGMALGTIPFIYYLYPLSNKYIKLFLAVLLIFSINIVVFTASRTGYIGLLGLAAFFWFGSRFRFRWLSYLLIAVLVSFPFIPDQYVERFSSIFGGVEKEGRSKEKRLEILADSFVIFVENPLGVGVSAFPAAREDRFGRRQDTHNLYMEVLTNIGIQGFVVWAGMIYVLISRLLGLRRRFEGLLSTVSTLPSIDAFNDSISSHVEDLKLFSAFSRAILAYVLMRLILGLFGHDFYEIYWWVATGGCLALNKLYWVASEKTRTLCSIELAKKVN